jgi:outer membrane protein assembly factor BamE (lipoprotein component of BamABCDE complex)
MSNLKIGFSFSFPVIILLFLLSGCQTIDVRGQPVSDESIEEIRTKKPTKEKLVEMIGTPTYVPDYTPDTWYYIQRSLGRRAWFDPKVVKQRIVEVKFDKNGKVREAILLTDTQHKNLAAISNYTKTYGTEQNVMQKFVKNIGKFNKTTDGAKKRNKKK